MHIVLLKSLTKNIYINIVLRLVQLKSDHATFSCKYLESYMHAPCKIDNNHSPV